MKVFEAKLISSNPKGAQVVVHSVDKNGVKRSTTRHVRQDSMYFVGRYPDNVIYRKNARLNDEAQAAATNAKARAEAAKLAMRLATERAKGKNKGLDPKTLATLQDQVSAIEAELSAATTELARVRKEHPLLVQFKVS